MGITNAKNVSGGGGSSIKRYGFAINKNDSNPATRFIYLYDAEGMTPAYMDFTAGEFNYGDWGDIWFVSGNKPCMVKSDGTIDYYLDPDNYAYQEDGITASDVANTAYDGNAMSYIPLVWIKRWEEGEYECFSCCQTQYDSDYKAYAHMRSDGSVMDYRLMSIFDGVYISDVTRSLSGQTPGGNRTVAAELTNATANGPLWYTWSFSEYALISDLLRLISRSDNTQNAFGYGNCNGSVLNSGQLNTAGQFFGYSSTASCVKVFHMENFWGNIWKRIAGLMNLSGSIYVKPYPTYNTTGSGYINTGLTPTGTSGSYIKTTKMTEYGRIGYGASGGSATTYACDGLVFNNSQNDYAMAGGDNGAKALGGPAYLDTHNAITAIATYIGSRISCEQQVS